MYLNEFKSLKSLNLDNHKFYSIHPDALNSIDFHHLTDISLSNNAIQSLNNAFANMANLECLNLSLNEIGHVSPNAFRGLTNLKVLNLSSNRIEFLADKTLFNDLTNLIQLNVSKQSIGQKSLKDCLKLFTNLKNLKILNLSMLRFGEPQELNLNSLSFLSSLEKFITYGNKLCKINPVFELNVLSKLTHLDLANNGIKELSGNEFEHLSGLKSLDLRLNQIENLKENVFSQLSSLQTLDLQKNPFKAINAKAFRGLDSIERLIIDVKSYDLIDLKNLTFNLNCLVKI